MVFPPPGGIRVGNLKRATPTPMTPAALRVQLGNVGLDCGEFNDNDLQRYINQVSSQLPNGSVRTFTILEPIEPEKETVDRWEDFVKAADGNWEVSDSPTILQWMSIFMIMQPLPRFLWLQANRNNNGFTGTMVNPPPSQGYFSNAEAIQRLFVEVGLSASSTLVAGLDKPSMEAALHNAIGHINDENIRDYDQPGSRLFGLLMNYNEQTGNASGVGYLATEWRLTIRDFRRKDKHGGNTNDTTLSTTSRSVLYTDPNLICAHFNAVVTQFRLSTPVSCPPP